MLIYIINQNINLCSFFRHDMNSMVTEKNSSIAFLTDNTNQIDESQYNFSLIHATTTTTIKLNQLEYDDNVDIDEDI